MGHVETDPAIASEQPSLQKFLSLCAETNIAAFPAAADWGINLLISGDFQERWRLAKVLRKVGDPICLPLLAIAEDKTQDVELRWFAVRILGQYRSAEVIVRLIVLLEDCREEFLADEIMRALVRLEEKATDYIVPLLQQPEMRLLAVKALCKVRYPNIVEPLLSVVQDEDPEVRSLALEALGGFRHELIFGCLLAGLQDPASSVRTEAVRALGFWANIADKNKIFAQVAPLLHDHNLEVCRQAGLTLSRLQTIEAVEAIAQVLQSETTPFSLKAELIQALSWIEHDASLEALGTILTTASEPLILEIIKVFGRINEANHRQAQATKILLRFWQQKSSSLRPNIRQDLAYSLGQLKQVIAQPLLTKLSEDCDSGVKLHAIAALNKLPTVNS